MQGWSFVCFLPFFICLSHFKRGLGSEFIGSDKWEGHWNPYFSRLLNDWKLDDLEELFSSLQGVVVDSEGEDKVG